MQLVRWKLRLRQRGRLQVREELPVHKLPCKPPSFLELVPLFFVFVLFFLFFSFLFKW